MPSFSSASAFGRNRARNAALNCVPDFFWASSSTRKSAMSGPGSLAASLPASRTNELTVLRMSEVIFARAASLGAATSLVPALASAASNLVTIFSTSFSLPCSDALAHSRLISPSACAFRPEPSGSAASATLARIACASVTSCFTSRADSGR